MSADGLTRILVAIDVPTVELTDTYPDGVIDEADVAASLRARLEEFYPGDGGYAQPTLVTVTAVPLLDEPIDPARLRGIYEVGAGL